MGSLPLRVALTGGIATGKSYCLRRFAELGVPVIDADVLAHDAIRRGTPGFDAVVGRFGPGVIGMDGEIDRRTLGRIVFADADARRDLEAIVHPAVYDAIRAWFEAPDDGAGRWPFRIADIPLLYETGGDDSVDCVIVAACRPEQQIERLRARGLAEGDARARIAAQLPIEEKARRADCTIDTSGTT